MQPRPHALPTDHGQPAGDAEEACSELTVPRGNSAWASSSLPLNGSATCPWTVCSGGRGAHAAGAPHAVGALSSIGCRVCGFQYGMGLIVPYCRAGSGIEKVWRVGDSRFVSVSWPG